MVRLPPAEKLPLALRKNIRDSWENKKSESEQKISEILGTAWTIDINPNAIYPYGDSDYAKDSLGDLIHGYVSGAAYQLSDFARSFGADGINDLNAAASAHVLTMDVDDSTSPVSYCGAAIKDGKLVIIFNPKSLGTNDSDALQSSNITKALNEAPAAAEGGASGLSFSAKDGIRKGYDAKVGAVQGSIAEQLGKSKDDVKLVPNFENLYTTLQANSSKLSSNWEEQLGPFVLQYFEGVQSNLAYNKCKEDEMIQEGVNEAVDKSTFEMRIVDKLKYASYCEVVVEDGKLFVQTTVDRWGVNIGDAANKIIDQL
ncbi:hypothetical protein Sste5346_008723 [Sporothrix stenoceras]|uniref:Uncharacterized protein n=1 Tax=Sporothrix stenoceras TaxID=5173 RepID=A0ABR3YP68_9PEZI